MLGVFHQVLHPAPLSCALPTQSSLHIHCQQVSLIDVYPANVIAEATCYALPTGCPDTGDVHPAKAVKPTRYARQTGESDRCTPWQRSSSYMVRSPNDLIRLGLQG